MMSSLLSGHVDLGQESVAPAGLTRALAATVATYEVGDEWLHRRMKRRGRVIPPW
jgi:hypothetical protein